MLDPGALDKENCTPSAAGISSGVNPDTGWSADILIFRLKDLVTPGLRLTTTSRATRTPDVASLASMLLDNQLHVLFLMMSW